LLLIVAILFEAANSGSTKTKIMYDVFILSVMLAAKTNIDQHCLKNCLMKIRRKELNYNKKVRIFDPRDLTVN
jgi:hypothetical protein